MKIYGIIRTVIYWTLTALVLAFASALAEIELLKYIIGSLLIFYGAEEIIFTVFKDKKHYSIGTLYWNIIEIIIGIILIIFVKADDIAEAYAIVCVCWAIWSILRETRELVEVTEKLKENKLIPVRIISVISIFESLTIIALSLTMIIEPGEHHALIHLYLLAVELFTRALYPLINYIADCYNAKKKIKTEDAAVEPTETELPEDAAVEHTEAEQNEAEDEDTETEIQSSVH